MLIRARFFGDLRECVGKSWLTMEIPDESSVQDFISAIAKEIDRDLRERLVDKKGEIHPKIAILVNGTNIVHLDGLRTKLKDHDLISVLPVVGGG